MRLRLEESGSPVEISDNATGGEEHTACTTNSAAQRKKTGGTFLGRGERGGRHRFADKHRAPRTVLSTSDDVRLKNSNRNLSERDRALVTTSWFAMVKNTYGLSMVMF